MASFSVLSVMTASFECKYASEVVQVLCTADGIRGVQSCEAAAHGGIPGGDVEERVGGSHLINLFIM